MSCQIETHGGAYYTVEESFKRVNDALQEAIPQGGGLMTLTLARGMYGSADRVMRILVNTDSIATVRDLDGEDPMARSDGL